MDVKDVRWTWVLLGVSGLIGVGAALYVAGWVLLPMIGVPLSYHRTWIWLAYWRAYPELRSGASVHALAGGLAVVATVTASLLLPLLRKQRSLHGDARFASASQIRRAGLNAEKGIIVGKQGNKYLVYGGQQHVFLAAPTRSGKGVGIAIPNLLSWPDSVVVTDIKGENWDITAGFREEHGQQCYFFNPTTYKTHRYNPLSYIDTDPNRAVDDIQKIASMLYPDLPGIDPIWNASCRALFLGLVLYLRETPERPLTIGEVVRCTMTRVETSKYLKDIIDTRETEGRPLSALCVQALGDYIAVTSENTRSSIKKTFTSRLELWLNPIIDAATSESDFDLRLLRKTRISLYIGITPDDLARLAPLVNLICQQAIDLNTRVLPSQDPTLKHSCLLLLDEFTAFGQIGVLAKGISYVAGYGLRVLPIVQSPAQIRDVYGRDAADTFMVNHAIHVVFAPREFRVAQEISESLGYETVPGRSISKRKNWWAAKEPTETTSDQRRALLLPQEVRDIGEEQAILLVEGTPPIKCQKIRYYKDRTFTSRVRPAPKLPTMDVDEFVRTRLGRKTSSPPVGTAMEGVNLGGASNARESGPGAAKITAPLATRTGDSRTGEAARGRIDWGSTFPTTIAMLAELTEDRTTNTPRAKRQLKGFSMDFSDVEIPSIKVTDEELRQLHRAFLTEAGVSDEQHS